jgi:hypothetical protein
MASNKLFEQHEKARAAAESAAKKYAEFLKGASKAREKDDQGNLRAQNKPVQREVRKGK